MQGNCVNALMISIVLLALAGCKGSPPPSPGPVAAPAPVPATPAVSNVVLNVHKAKKGFDVHMGVLTPGSVVQWHYDSMFYVEFQRNQNPCEPGTTPPGPNVYSSHLVQNSTPAIYEVKCTIASNPEGTSFSYEIELGVPRATPPRRKQAGPPPSTPFSGHCEGCVIGK